MTGFAVWRSVACFWKGGAGWQGWRQVTTGRGQDKSAMSTVAQVSDLAWFLSCRSVGSSAADRVFFNDYKAVSGTVPVLACWRARP